MLHPGMRLTVPVRHGTRPSVPAFARVTVHSTPAVVQAPAPAVPAPATVTTVSTAGEGAFEQCVEMRESGDDPTAYNASSGASGLFGFLLSTWDSLGLGYPGGAYTAPASVQQQGFRIEYTRAGTSPWRPYDGC